MPKLPKLPALPTDSPRYALRDQYREALSEAAEKVKGGPWDGRSVVAIEKVREILDAKIPPSSDHGAEVRTPGKVVVTGVCRQCSISSILQVEEDSAEGQEQEGQPRLRSDQSRLRRWPGDGLRDRGHRRRRRERRES